LQENKKKIDAAIADKKLSIDEVQAEIRAKMASSKSLENELRLSKASIAIATIAKQYVESKLPVPGPLIKPSYFELLTWETEVYRLEKCLRETRH
jgi:hypothetical protein